MRAFLAAVTLLCIAAIRTAASLLPQEKTSNATRADTSVVRQLAARSALRPDTAAREVRFAGDTAFVKVAMSRDSIARGGVPFLTVRVERVKGRWRAVVPTLDTTP